MKARFLPSAHRDLERLREFLLPKNPDAADRAIDTLFDAAESLEAAPYRGRPIGREFRELIVPFGDAAYIMRYRVSDKLQIAAIVRIWHSKEERA